MLGLRADIDPSSRIITGISNTKSFKFSERNIGRFHTSGISGGMRKHQENKLKFELLSHNNNNNNNNNNNEEINEKNQLNNKYTKNKIELKQKEIEEETKQLLELEAKLEEIKLQKKLKQERREARNKQRMEYISATKIQAVYRSHLSRKSSNAVKILGTFLKACSNKHALVAAFWAAKKIARFSSKVGREYRLRKKHQAVFRYVVTSTWLNVIKTTCKIVAIRREFAHNFVHRILSIGLKTVTLCISTARKQKRKILATKSLSLNRSTSGKHQYNSNNRSSVVRKSFSTNENIPSSHLSPIQQHQRDEKDRILFNQRMYRKKTVFSDYWYNPATGFDYLTLARSSGLISPNKTYQRLQTISFENDSENNNYENNINKKGHYNNKSTINEDNEKLKRLALLHKQKEEEMEIERQKRLQYIEEQKRLREKELLEKQLEEQREKERLEKMKVEFFQRIVAEQSKRAKIVNKIREDKVKIIQTKEELLKQEKENQKNELKLMFHEDIRFEQNLEKQRKKILQFGQNTSQDTTIGTSVVGVNKTRPNSASMFRKKVSLISNENNNNIIKNEGISTTAIEETDVKKPELPKVGIKVVKKVVPVLSKEEEERIELEKEEKRKEKALQQEQREIALKKRLAAKLAQEREEKEKALIAEELKKKEQEMILMKASLLVKKDLERKEEMMKERRKRGKETMKKKLREKGNGKGTSSAGSNELYPLQSGITKTTTTGSAPLSSIRSNGNNGNSNSNNSNNNWENAMIDPLELSYVARNGGQVNEKASDWGWNDGNEYHSPFNQQKISIREDEAVVELKSKESREHSKEEFIVKGNFDDGYLDAIGSINEEYNFSENFINNSSSIIVNSNGDNKSSIITPYVTDQNQSGLDSINNIPIKSYQGGVVLPQLGQMKTNLIQKHVSETELPTYNSLSTSFSAMISSQSRPNIPIGKLPLAVEKVLKRRNQNKLGEKEEKKIGKVASLAEIIKRAKEKLSVDKNIDDNQNNEINSHHDNNIESVLIQDIPSKKMKENILEVEETIENVQIKSSKKSSQPKKLIEESNINELNNNNINKKSTKLLQPSNLNTNDNTGSDLNEIKKRKDTVKKEKKVKKNEDVDKKDGTKKQNKKKDKLELKKENQQNSNNNYNDNNRDGNENSDDDDSIVEKYFSMKRKTQEVKKEIEKNIEKEKKIELNNKPKTKTITITITKTETEKTIGSNSDDEFDSIEYQNEYLAPSPMFPNDNFDTESFPTDLPIPIRRSFSGIDTTPLDLSPASYYNGNHSQLLDHKSHSIIEGEDENNEEDENNSNIQIDRTSFVIQEDENEEPGDEELEKQSPIPKKQQELQLNKVNGNKISSINNVNETENDYEDDWEGNENITNSNLRNNQENKNKEENNEELYSPDYHQQDENDENFDEGSGEVSGDGGDEYERLLNLECENLRRRLEEKIMFTKSMSNSQETHQHNNDEDEDEEEENGDDDDEDEYSNEYDQDDFENH